MNRVPALSTALAMAASALVATAVPAAATPSFAGPWDVADGPAANTVWITSTGTGRAPAHRLELYNYRTHRIVKQVEVGSEPRGVAASANRRTAWVANYGSSTVTVINARSAKVARTVSVAAGRPYGVALSANGKRAVVVSNSRYLTILDTRTFRVVRRVRLSELATGSIVLSASGSTAFVGVFKPDGVGGTLDVVNLVHGRVSALPVSGGAPNALALAPNGRTLYVATQARVFSLSTRTLHVIRSQYVNGNYSPEHIGVSRDGRQLWITFSGYHDLLGEFSATSFAYLRGVSYPDHSGLHDAHVTADGRYVVVTLRAADRVAVVAT